jgi:hypothetical protein
MQSAFSTTTEIVSKTKYSPVIRQGLAGPAWFAGSGCVVLSEAQADWAGFMPRYDYLHVISGPGLPGRVCKSNGVFRKYKR